MATDRPQAQGSTTVLGGLDDGAWYEAVSTREGTGAELPLPARDAMDLVLLSLLPPPVPIPRQAAAAAASRTNEEEEEKHPCLMADPQTSSLVFLNTKDAPATHQESKQCPYDNSSRHRGRRRLKEIFPDLIGEVTPPGHGWWLRCCLHRGDGAW